MFNTATPTDEAIRKVGCLLATIRGLSADVGVNGDDGERSKIWAMHYLAEMAETIAENLA